MGHTQDGFAEIAKADGLHLEKGTRLAWLSKFGHTLPRLEGVVPASTLTILRRIHRELGGDEAALRGKGRTGANPTPDFTHPRSTWLIEVDEDQHFTSDRLRTFRNYPAEVPVAYDVEAYQDLIRRWADAGDRYRSKKTATDFAFEGGRRAQRAYFDAFRDLVAPSFGVRVMRVPAPERNPELAYTRFIALRRCFHEIT